MDAVASFSSKVLQEILSIRAQSATAPPPPSPPSPTSPTSPTTPPTSPTSVNTEDDRILDRISDCISSNKNNIDLEPEERGGGGGAEQHVGEQGGWRLGGEGPLPGAVPSFGLRQQPHPPPSSPPTSSPPHPHPHTQPQPQPSSPTSPSHFGGFRVAPPGSLPPYSHSLFPEACCSPPLGEIRSALGHDFRSLSPPSSPPPPSSPTSPASPSMCRCGGSGGGGGGSQIQSQSHQHDQGHQSHQQQQLQQQQQHNHESEHVHGDCPESSSQCAMRGRDHKTGFAESLRNEYMSIMKNVESDPGATRAAFERIGASLAKMISSSPSALDHDSVSDSEAAALADMYLCSSLMYKGVQYNRVVNTPGRSAFLIGSYSVCDMRVGSMMQGVSRVHVILFLIPGKNVVLVDPGSLCGFVSKPFDQHNAPVHTHSHEESETEHTPDISPSKPAHSGGKRKQVVVYKWAQAFYLKVPGVTMRFTWAKECVVCLSLPRSIRFNCGHCVTCHHCSRHVRECPVCRLPVGFLVNDLSNNLATFVSYGTKS